MTRLGDELDESVSSTHLVRALHSLSSFDYVNVGSQLINALWMLSLGRPLADGTQDDSESSMINPEIAQAIAGIPKDQVHGLLR